MNIPAGTAVYIGPPAKPIAEEISRAKAVGLGQLPEAVEAYLARMYAKSYIDARARVLLLVLENAAPDLKSRVSDVLRAVLPSDSHLDVMQWRATNPSLPTVRNNGTKLNLSRKPN